MKKGSDTIALFLFSAVLILGFLDITADASLGGIVTSWEGPMGTSPMTMCLQVIAIYLIIGLTFRCLLNFLTRRSVYKSNPDINLFLVMFFLANMCGIMTGLFNGIEPKYVIGDSRNVIIYMALFSIYNSNFLEVTNGLKKVLFICFAILIFKLLGGHMVHHFVFGGLSWRYILKLNAYFSAFLCLFLCLYVTSKSRAGRIKYMVLMLLSVYGVGSTQMRGVFLGTAVGLLFIYIFFTGGIDRRRLYFAYFIIAVVITVPAIIQRSDISVAFGDWQGESYTYGIEYRTEQMHHLLSIIEHNWLFGAGLGYFDPNYETYADLVRPYLLELDWLNLVAKLGLVGSSLMFGSFFFLFRGCIMVGKQISNLEHRGMVCGLAAGLLSMMVASISNTGYSSLYFHQYVVILLLILSIVIASHKSELSSRMHQVIMPTAVV